MGTRIYNHNHPKPGAVIRFAEQTYIVPEKGSFFTMESLKKEGSDDSLRNATRFVNNHKTRDGKEIFSLRPLGYVEPQDQRDAVISELQRMLEQQKAELEAIKAAMSQPITVENGDHSFEIQAELVEEEAAVEELSPYISDEQIAALQAEVDAAVQQEELDKRGPGRPRKGN